VENRALTDGSRGDSLAYILLNWNSKQAVPVLLWADRLPELTMAIAWAADNSIVFDCLSMGVTAV
jgi:hypothetical protein